VLGPLHRGDVPCGPQGTSVGGERSAALACSFAAPTEPAELYSVKQAIKEAYELAALVATLVMGAAIQVFTTPTQLWDEWKTLSPYNLKLTGLTSGWVIITSLVEGA
jgi:hypothetical protein